MNPQKQRSVSIAFFLVVSLFAYSFQQDIEDSSEVKWYSMPPDEIILNTYQSPNKIDPTRHPDYMDWVNYRNAFRYSKDNAPIAKSVEYFVPEDSGYYADCISFGGFFIALAVISFVLILVYLFIRFVKKGCVGQKNKRLEAVNDKYRWALVFGGGLLTLVSFICMMSFSDRQ